MTIQNYGAVVMPLRPPMGARTLLAPGLLFAPAPTETAYQLDNGLAHFDFAQDKGGGFRMKQAVRIGGATWANVETDLWRIGVFDTTSTESLSTSLIGPSSAYLGAPVVVSTANKSIGLTWTNVSVGAVDLLNVSVLLELRAGEDWLRASMVASWVGTPSRYAVDYLCVLPLRLAPMNQGIDYAAFSTDSGIQQKDPIKNLRYDPTGGKPSSLFGGTMRNVNNSQSGRGWSMPVWAYHETSGTNGAGEGWMSWDEQWDLTPKTTCFQSDGSNMLLETCVPMPNNLAAGNGGATLAINGTCLRPMRFASPSGWYHAAAHYRERLAVAPPAWLRQKRVVRSDLSAIEKAPSVFVEFANTAFSGSTAYMPGAIATLRTKLGITTATPIFGVTVQPHQNLLTPYEPEIGDARAMLAALYTQNVFLGTFAPASTFAENQNAGSLIGNGPAVWSKYQQSGNDLRWWTNLDGQGVLRESRRGLLLGGGADRLAEGPASVFDRERTYPVVSWNAGTKTLTVTGTPGTDGFQAQPSGSVSAILVPASGGARLADAAVIALSGSTIQVAATFKDGQGNVITPDNTYTVVLAKTSSDAAATFCPHAASHSAAFKANLAANVLTGRFTVERLCGSYFDNFDEPLLPKYQEYHLGCYRNHSGWSKIDGGYVQHPLGGGNWYVQAMNDFFNALRADVRAAQVAASGTTAHMIYVEDISESSAWADIAFHNMADGGLWRNLAGIDPNVHGVKVVPMYAAVHAGESFVRGINHEFSSGAIQHGYETNTQLHRTQASQIAEWVYGMTLLTISLYADDANGFIDVFDETKYLANGGTVSNEFRSIRDFWVQCQLFELNGGLKWFRYGTFLRTPAVDTSVTGTVTGFADTTFNAGTLDVIYDRAATPRVLPQSWLADDESSLLVMLPNWTEQDTPVTVTVDLAEAGLTGGSSIKVTILDKMLQPLAVPAAIDATTGKLSISNVPSYTLYLAKLEVVPLTVGGAALPASVVQGVNSYVESSFADEYMAGSVAGADNWSVMGDDQKSAALITAWRQLERQNWAGTRAANTTVVSLLLTATGFGYALGDVISVVGGVGLAAQAEVTSVDSFGSILGATLISTGEYTTAPTTPNTLLSDSRAGFGAMATLTFSTQATAWPRTNVQKRDGGGFYDGASFPLPLMQAQVELAYALSQKPSIESARNSDSLVKSVGAGPVRVDFWKPTVGQGRFPPVVQELLAQLFSGVPIGGMQATGNHHRSEFREDQFGLKRPMP